MVEAEQYAHVLLFACPQCGRPLTSVCTSARNNLEAAQVNWFAPHCHCGWSGDVAGVTAVKHWVEPWHGPAPAAGEAGSCDREEL